VLSCLRPVWTRVPETASRLRGRIEAVFDFARAHGHRAGENPAAWKGNLAHLLAQRPKLARAHQAAMAVTDVPAFMASLRECPSTAARALEFLILTAARLSEARFARYDEVSIDEAVWSLTPARTKAGRAHKVPLSDRALEIVKGAQQAPRQPAGNFIFTSPTKRGRPISDNVMRALVPSGCSIHGFRSAFADWAAECGHPRELVEQSLAHLVGNAVERAYRRTDLIERRRALLSAWSAYCAGAVGDNVIAIGRRL